MHIGIGLVHRPSKSVHVYNCASGKWAGHSYIAPSEFYHKKMLGGLQSTINWTMACQFPISDATLFCD